PIGARPRARGRRADAQELYLGGVKAATPAVKPRATLHWYEPDCSRLRSDGFVMNPVSTRIAGTFAQLKPVRSLRPTSPLSFARVAATGARWTSRAARRLRP